MPASLRELRQRRKSVTATKKITRAMELIASSRIIKAQQAAARALPFTRELNRAVSAVANKSRLKHPLTMDVENPQRVAVLIAHLVQLRGDVLGRVPLTLGSIGAEVGRVEADQLAAQAGDLVGGAQGGLHGAILPPIRVGSPVPISPTATPIRYSALAVRGTGRHTLSGWRNR